MGKKKKEHDFGVPAADDELPVVETPSEPVKMDGESEPVKEAKKCPSCKVLNNITHVPHHHRVKEEKKEEEDGQERDPGTTDQG